MQYNLYHLRGLALARMADIKKDNKNNIGIGRAFAHH